jgi:hypothetical protein
VAEPEAVEARAGPAETFLLRYVRANPGVRFGAIVGAVEQAHRISRATAARQLARLVRFGEIQLRPDHTYVARGAPTTTTRALLETRWYDNALTVHPDGTARVVIEEEFRVRSGELDHLDFPWPKPTRTFGWWATVSARLSEVRPREAPTGQYTHRVRFSAPLSAKDPTWQRYRVVVDLPTQYRMYFDAGKGSRNRDVAPPSALETEIVDFSSQDRRFGQRFAPDAHLRIQVALPEGYPIGAAGPRVRFLNEPELLDTGEESRLAALADTVTPIGGFQQEGSWLLLTVPRPIMDRRYEIEWTLPTLSARERWLAERRRQAIGRATSTVGNVGGVRRPRRPAAPVARSSGRAGVRRPTVRRPP